MKKYRRPAERRGKREALEDKRARRGLLERWLDQSGGDPDGERRGMREIGKNAQFNGKKRNAVIQQS